MSVRFAAVIERKLDDLPRFVVAPFPALEVFGTEGRVNVRGTLSGVAFEHRGLLPFGDGRHFMNLPASLCRDAAVDVGDTVEIVIEQQAEDIPEELTAALARDPDAAAAWERLSPSHRREHAGFVREAKRHETRVRRAAASVARLRLTAG